MRISTVARPLAALAVTAALTLTVAPATHADDAPPADSPCATQEAKVAKAEDALARVTAVFARQKDKVADAEAAVAAAETDKERAKAEKRLAHVQAKAADAKLQKKAQKQRLAKAQGRLADCEAANPPA